ERSIQIGMDLVEGLYPSLQDSEETVRATDTWRGLGGAVVDGLSGFRAGSLPRRCRAGCRWPRPAR
ncbi:hypothetical protein AB0R12_41145, partial [Streptomyces niveus]|uniref:hypothetical protein n=1 Tax=Streptomyces niveus TaxID=193462 RepID=UPI00344459A4